MASKKNDKSCGSYTETSRKDRDSVRSTGDSNDPRNSGYKPSKPPETTSGPIKNPIRNGKKID